MSKNDFYIQGAEPSGYVVKNIYGGGEPFLTENGKVLIWPNIEAIPAGWRAHAHPATPSQHANGHMARRVVLMLETKDDSQHGT